MSEDERERWDRRYAEGDYAPRDEPTPFVLEWLPHIPGGRALDVATGTGRNALHLAAAGFDVDAVDISAVAVDRGREQARRRGLEVNWVVTDLDHEPLPRDDYDLITVVRYRNPELWPRLQDALAPDGWILIEHHLRTPLDVGGPGDATFRLEPGELLAAFGDLRVLHYSEQVEPSDDGSERFAIGRLAACAGDLGW